ncbi:MAG: DUF1285 domain-containing protein [Halieaceae bacterium]
MTDDGYARLIQNASAASETSEGAPVFAGSVNGCQPYPLDKWHPTNCGFVDISIDRDGRWFHEGSEIKRYELVSLFAGLLRREDDGCYYLVTPVEKVEVDVALHPLMVVDAAPMAAEEEPVLALVLNTGGVFRLDADTGLQPEARAAGASYVNLPNGLSALFTRAAWYRLVELADEDGCIFSGGERFSLLATH